MAALFKVLQKAYPDRKSSLVINPDLKAYFTESDCMLTINSNEFLVNFTRAGIKESVTFAKHSIFNPDTLAEVQA